MMEYLSAKGLRGGAAPQGKHASAGTPSPARNRSLRLRRCATSHPFVAAGIPPRIVSTEPRLSARRSGGGYVKTLPRV